MMDPCDNHTIRGKLEWRDKGPENGRVAWLGICGGKKAGCGGSKARQAMCWTVGIDEYRLDKDKGDGRD